MISELKNKAKELLKTKQVELVIGYMRSYDDVSAMPAFIDKEEDVDLLVWDAYCVHNLANYLMDFPNKKTAIVAKPCDAKSITVLLNEKQIKRENIFIIGVECSGIIDVKRAYLSNDGLHDINFDERCRKCAPSAQLIYDVLISQKEKKPHAEKIGYDPYDSVRKLEIKSIQEKFSFWQEEFSRCIRCYACRQICPLCYCPRCVADQMSPSWFSKAVNLEGNFSWNVTRAMHLAGRCIDCGECERACPVGIPLRDINKKIEKDIKELFNYEAGSSTGQKLLLGSFDKNDPGDFIK